MPSNPALFSFWVTGNPVLMLLLVVNKSVTRFAFFIVLVWLN